VTSAPKLTVLGGSTPFTTALFDAIAGSDYRLQPHELMLFGRDEAALDIVTRRAQHCLGPFGWVANNTTDMEEALRGAHYIVHQIRYGGLDGREFGERLSERFGLPADETLGPAALRIAIRGASAVRQTARAIAAHCPGAWTLNLTNPLSVTTAQFIAEGVTRCVGICELPESTAMAVADALGIEFARMRWEYVGLNHRGFLYNLSLDGQPLMGAIAQALPARCLPGITVNDLDTLDAVPLKYFSMLRTSGPRVRRAQVLRDLRAELLRELAADPTVSPPSLWKRNVDWYSKAVVPILAALASPNRHSHVVNVMGADGVVIETVATIGSNRVITVRGSLPSAAVQCWMGRFTAHEEAVLDVMLAPTEAAIRKALTLDPLVPSECVDPLTLALLEDEPD